MITIKNTQRSHKIDVEKVHSDAQTILDELNYSDFDLGIWFTTSKTVRQYNKEYRKKDKATDILSFPYHPDLQPGKRIKVTEEEDKNVGDIVIAVEFVENLLPLYQTTLQKRISVLLIHGICHLLGYTHYDDENDQKMIAKERSIATKLGIKKEML
jgi:probable rRNA maturation factor